MSEEYAKADVPLVFLEGIINHSKENLDVPPPPPFEQVDKNITDNSIQFYEDEFFDEYGKTPSLNELLLYRMLYQYITLIRKKSESRNIYLKSKSSVDKYYSNLDHRILDAYHMFVDDIQSYIPDYCCNLIGGKVSDYFDGKTFEESDGDYDIWMCSDSFSMTPCNVLVRYFAEKYELISDTGRYYEFKTNFLGKEITFQLIKETFSSIEEILNGFDFLHCCLGYDGSVFFWKRGALKSVKKKEIFINKVSPTRVLNERLNKYMNRGYKISFPSFSLLSISALFGLVGMSIDTTMYYKYLDQYPEQFIELRGSNNGY